MSQIRKQPEVKTYPPSAQISGLFYRIHRKAPQVKQINNNDDFPMHLLLECIQHEDGGCSEDAEVSRESSECCVGSDAVLE